MNSQEQIRARIEVAFAVATKKFGINWPYIDIRFDLKGKAAGMAGYVGREYYLRFNTHFMREDLDFLIDEVVPHEVAHLVCFINPELGNRHDRGWQQVCLALGGNGKTRHDRLVIFGKGKTFAYTATCGTVAHVSEKMHLSIQAGRTYRLKANDGRLAKGCAFTLVGVNGHRVSPTPLNEAPTQNPSSTADKTPVQAPPRRVTTSVVPRGRSTTGTSKADRVRARIVEAKRNNQTPEVVVAWVVMNLDMSLALAKKYVKENWVRV